MTLVVVRCGGNWRDGRFCVRVCARCHASLLPVIDTAHGHSSRVIDAVKEIKQRHPNTKIYFIAGNVGTQEGAQELMQVLMQLKLESHTLNDDAKSRRNWRRSATDYCHFLA